MATCRRSFGWQSARPLAAAALLALMLHTRATRADDDVRFADATLPVREIVSALHERKPVSMKPIGTSSLVFKVDLDGAIDAAFRPENRLNPRGHLAELSAFRVGQLLGLHNVAPVVARSFPLADLEKLLLSSYRERWPGLRSELLVREGNLVSGVCVYWITDLQELGIDTPEGVKRWARWLAQDGALPESPDTRDLARQISDMLVFDYLIGNFDRFSGANAQGNAAEGRLYLRDHNMAFFEPLRPQHHHRVLARLKRVQRFSRRLVDELRSLTEQRLADALLNEEGPVRGPLLTKGQMAALLDRKRAILSYVSALIERHGEHNVLTFE
jgi:Golgi casein kinase, C-terminal, Fam20